MEGFDINNATFKSLIGLSISQLEEEKWKLKFGSHRKWKEPMLY
jgi:hypothetical protein